jgi:glycosyltransferase involved in cell wall biosynthesis
MESAHKEQGAGGALVRVCIVANSAWYLVNFRRQLGRRLRDLGHDVTFIAPRDKYVDALTSEGFRFHDWALASAGKNPAREACAVHGLRRILQEEAPTHVFSYTPKANIYSGLALFGLKARFFPNVSGLGRVFISRGLLTHVATTLYKLAFRRAEAVVFQNTDDQEVFRSLGITRGKDTVKVPGSGVDLTRFQPSPLPALHRPGRRFLFVGRLLGDKGIVEYVEAAAAIRKTRDDCEFVVVGSTLSDNPAAVPVATVAEWVRQGIIQHIEHVEDIRPHLHEADCVVLPSYREGVPRSLLEAAAVGRPVVTTDAPGCRETVLHGETGLLCQVRDAKALEQSLRGMLALDLPAWVEMGRQGRAYMERKFSEEYVLGTYQAFCEPAMALRAGEKQP